MLNLVLLAAVALAAPTVQDAIPHAPVQKKTVPGKKTSQTSLTGCVDEQDGNYVLVDDRMLGKLADLEAVGASDEAVFAKHMGHKVLVKGTRAEPAAKFKVTSIEDISPVCAPAQPNPQ